MSAFVKRTPAIGAVAWRIAAWLQPRHVFDVPSQIRRRVDQKPTVKTFRVSADGDARLRLWRNLPGTRGRTIRARTVPLWQAAAGCTA